MNGLQALAKIRASPNCSKVIREGKSSWTTYSRRAAVADPKSRSRYAVSNNSCGTPAHNSDLHGLEKE